VARISTPPPRRRIIASLVVIALAGASLTSIQCRNIEDPAVQLQMGNYAPLSQQHKECTMKCDFAYRVAMDQEMETHRLLIKGCGGDMQCRSDEHERYRIAKKVIEQSKTTCKAACRYNEGAGLGGK